MPGRNEPEKREAVSAEEYGRRIRAAGFEEMDRMGSQYSGWMFGGLLASRRRKHPQPRTNTAELEAKLRQREEEQRLALYRPRQSRWWHALWPFGRS